ncbi:MAG: hypothetical protein M0R77_08620 [Gammaproteobacteria bacterium]|nr:hypothetical protein [Gammaproteobacteria bacterium]
MLVGVHKSIRRFLKRTFLVKHSECVRLRRAIDTIPCPVARAFIAWDRAWSSLIPDWDQFERDGFFDLRNAVSIEKDGYIGSEGTKILLRESLIRRRLFAQAIFETFLSAWELSNAPIVAVRGNEIGWPAMVLSPPDNHSRVSTLWLCRRDAHSATRIVETANKIGGAPHAAQVVEEAKRHIEFHRRLMRKMPRAQSESDDS